MSQTATVNRSVTLASRPIGAPKLADFSLQRAPVPVPGPGEVLLRTVYLSLDPYMRGRMSDVKSYAPPVALGGVMTGGTVSRVQTSHHEDYQEGDLVVSPHGWQDYAVSNGDGLRKLESRMAQPSLALGLLGMTGFTAYVGLLELGRPRAGETVVVAAASGAVGSVVGQLARLKGCRAVGIAGGPEKCGAVVDELGFDACVDRHSREFASLLREACPNGIDVYFESVGGAVFDAVVPLLNTFARVPVCGLISTYNNTNGSTASARLDPFMGTLLAKRIKVQGFIIGDSAARFAEFSGEMGAWFKAGRLLAREDVVDGLENAPAAFIGLLEGRNRGKAIVQVARDSR